MSHGSAFASLSEHRPSFDAALPESAFSSPLPSQASPEERGRSHVGRCLPRKVHSEHFWTDSVPTCTTISRNTHRQAVSVVAIPGGHIWWACGLFDPRGLPPHRLPDDAEQHDVSDENISRETSMRVSLDRHGPASSGFLTDIRIGTATPFELSNASTIAWSCVASEPSESTCNAIDHGLSLRYYFSSSSTFNSSPLISGGTLRSPPSFHFL